MQTKFPQSEIYLAIVMGFKQPECIAEQVLPVVPVSEEKFTYHEISLEDSLQLPDTKVGRKSYPNEMETGATERTDRTEDHAIDDFVPNSDLDKARAGFNPKTQAVSDTMSVIKRRQEYRVRELTFNPDNYAAANKEDIAASQFSDNAVNPITIIEDAKETRLVVPNQAVIGRDVYSALRRNPHVVKAVFRNSGDSGIVPKNALEDLFEMEFLVGGAAVNIAKKGQQLDWQRLWKNHMLLQHIDKTASASSPTLTHGFIAHYDNVGGEIADQKRGIKGGVTVRAGHQRKEVITSELCSYLIANAV